MCDGESGVAEGILNDIKHIMMIFKDSTGSSLGFRR